MGKLLKRLINYLFSDILKPIKDKVDSIDDKVIDCSVGVYQLSENVNKYLRLQNDIPVDYSDNIIDLTGVFNDYMAKIRRSNDIHIINTVDNALDERIKFYDKMLYKSTEVIYKSGSSLLNHIILMEEIRYFILEALLNEDGSKTYSDIGNFDLYIVDTDTARINMNSIPHIDKSKIKIIPIGTLITSDNYICITMDRSGIEIIGPNTTVCMKTKYFRTVLRVFYSIYMNKFYLYRLEEYKSIMDKGEESER